MTGRQKLDAELRDAYHPDANTRFQIKQRLAMGRHTTPCSLTVAMPIVSKLTQESE
jgi:hypothetical protein